MSPAKGRKGRFGYLAGAAGAEAAETAEAAIRPEEEAGEGTRGAAQTGANESEGRAETASPDGGVAQEAGRRGRGEAAKGARGRSSRSRHTATSRKAPEEKLESVPKGKGRMMQERSQLNVRIPTALKRQASAKAVLEGEDIGEVIERLLREYLDK